MKKITATVERILYSPYHFLILSLYFVFRMYAHNLHSIPFIDFARPALLSVLAGWILYRIILRIVREQHTAALMTSICIIAFYTYRLGWELAFIFNLTKNPNNRKHGRRILG